MKTGVRREGRVRQGSRGVSEQRVYAKRMRLLDTGLSARTVEENKLT